MPSEGHKELLKNLEQDLAELRGRDQLRSLAQVAGVNLCSNDYLGLAEDSRLKEAVLEGVTAVARMGGTGSRLLSGHDPLWNELEDEFAAFAGTEAALYFSSGYSANVGLLTAVLGKHDLVFSDALNHASLIDGIRLSGARKEIYPHCDLNYLEWALRAHEGERCRKLVVTESVFSMDGDVANIAAMQKLAERYGACLIVDEAHATGVHGPGGSGLVAEERLTCEAFAMVHTCGKALASAGAFVCGSRVLREILINHARTLIFSTAAPPYLALQIRAALRLAHGMDSARKTLLQNSLTLGAGIHSLLGDRPGVLPRIAWSKDEPGLAPSFQSEQKKPHAVAATSPGSLESLLEPGSTKRYSQIVPVVLGSNEDALSAARFLQEQGFAVRAIRPPTVPEGTARLRLSLTTRVTHEHVSGILAALKAWRASQCTLASAGHA